MPNPTKMRAERNGDLIDVRNLYAFLSDIPTATRQIDGIIAKTDNVASVEVVALVEIGEDGKIEEKSALRTAMRTISNIESKRLARES